MKNEAMTEVKPARCFKRLGYSFLLSVGLMALWCFWGGAGLSLVACDGSIWSLSGNPFALQAGLCFSDRSTRNRPETGHCSTGDARRQPSILRCSKRFRRADRVFARRAYGSNSLRIRACYPIPFERNRIDVQTPDVSVRSTCASIFQQLVKAFWPVTHAVRGG